MAVEYLVVFRNPNGLGWAAAPPLAKQPKANAEEEEMLDFYGTERWELVTITNEPTTKYYFKRPRE